MAHHRSGAFLFALLIASFGFVGCSGLVAGNNGNPPPTTLAITNVLIGSATTSSCQVDWTTNVPADSAVDYGTSTVYGSSTPVDPAMVTSHQVVLSGLAPGTVYYYQVRSTDSKSNNAHSSSHSFKTSGGGPSITMQPTSQTVTAGQTASFSVAATGTAPLNYQWNRNGTGISGATSSSYTTPATTSSDNGAQFTVVVSNTAGSVTSSAATLTVNAQPVQITASSLAGGQVLTAYSATLQATGGTAPYTWSLLSGQLPNGLTLSSLSGIISGTPTVAALFNFTIQVHDSAGMSASTIFSIDITTITHSVMLTWNPSTSVVVGYNIYRGMTSGGPYTRLNSSADPGTTYTDSTVQSTLTYFYVVTAVDSTNVESVYSNEVPAAIP